jgi:hypothetical protein
LLKASAGRPGARIVAVSNQRRRPAADNQELIHGIYGIDNPELIHGIKGIFNGTFISNWECKGDWMELKHDEL